MKHTLLVCLFITTAIVAGCKQSTVESDSSGNSSDSSDVELVLHVTSDGHRKVGMGVGFELQIINHQPFSVQFDDFLNEGKQGQSFFAFTRPSAAHLFGPDGQDLLAVYSQESSVLEQPIVVDRKQGSTIEQFEPLQVEANAESWQFFQLWQLAVLDQPGTYTFWVELEDNFGQLHQSNKVDFTLEGIEQSVLPEFLELEVQFERDRYTIVELLDVKFEYGFKNSSDETLLFLRRLYFNLPIQSPVFQLIVRDAKGRILPIILSDAPQYISIDELHYIPLQPGQQHFQTDYLPYFPGMYTPGEYTIQLIYTVFENDILSGKPLNWKENVFIGRLESNEVILTVEE